MTEVKSKLRELLTAEVKFIVLIVTIVLGAVAPFYGIRQDIALIQKDIEHINVTKSDDSKRFTAIESHVEVLTAKVNEIEGGLKSHYANYRN